MHNDFLFADIDGPHKTNYSIGKATELFDSDCFKKNYFYDGDDLGAAVCGNKTTFKVWSPTASSIILNLYTSGHEGDAYKSIGMSRGERGIWSHTEPCGHGIYYTYTVTTAHGTHTVTDPYAKAAGLNGKRGMVVDLSLTDPEGWDDDASFTTGIESYTDASLWEVHVRDFSNMISSAKYKGKYLAFTETGLKNHAGISVGIDYLKQLGVTHVHLLPISDYATVDEANPDGQFNWGYDPQNYNVPEGSYSTDPYHGEVRIKEFKQAVMALHKAGLGVVIDVVYNHTYSADSSFERLVPYYYYRFTESGENTSASGCGNDTAPERYMFRKFMVDSVSYWMREYHLDGLRFDLMGLHDLETMASIEKAVHEIDPRAIIYGEGWTMGETVDGSPMADQRNIEKINAANNAVGAVAVFNDVIRDGLKGSTFFESESGYLQGRAAENREKIKFGISGGSLDGFSWQVKDAMVINYMSAHDNHTLWDKLALTSPNATKEQRAAMNRLGAVIVMISQGTPFMQAGEEMLRSKSGDGNSYKSGDEVNNIKWETLTPKSLEYETMQYYRGLLEMRRAYGLFTDGTNTRLAFDDLDGGALAVHFEGVDGSRAVAVINPSDQTIKTTLDGEYDLVVNGSKAGAEPIEKASSEVAVDARSANVYVKL